MAPAQQLVVVFGGNGFVGLTILKRLAALEGVTGIGVSRKPPLPSDKLEWRAGNALDASSYESLLTDASAVVVSIGSPPIPLVDYDTQFSANGPTNSKVLETAAKCGVKRAVLINATMPEWVPKGYRDGKLAAEASAHDFAKDGRSAVVIKPSAIYGTRNYKGFPIPLTPLFAPVSWLLRASTPLNHALIRTAPSLFRGVLVPPVPVDSVAAAAVSAALDSSSLAKPSSVTVLDPDAILRYT